MERAGMDRIRKGGRGDENAAGADDTVGEGNRHGRALDPDVIYRTEMTR